ncbi:hypothetical protein LTR08_007235 [Meristemomyces frigidus]|nr:hypothetical protein LTR08_007235 [Meristemomyces frigidus]
MKTSLALASISALLAGTTFAHPPSYPPTRPSRHPYPTSTSTATPATQNWNLANFTSLVVFGDSYTDDSRLGYFISHAGAAPPVAYANPESLAASDGGRIWPEYVKQYTGANLYNYAVSGAVCDNNITPRWFSAIDAPFPAIAQYELPAYLADSAYHYPNGTKFMTDPVDATVYAIWIGTNDLGYSAFIQDEQVAGTNLTTYIDCVYAQLARLYAAGGRNFVLMNVAPLNLAPIYEAEPFSAGDNQYWTNRTDNFTETSGRMMEQVVAVNAVFEYRTPFEVLIGGGWAGASFAVYDVNGLVGFPLSLSPLTSLLPSLWSSRSRNPRFDFLVSFADDYAPLCPAQMTDIIHNPSEYLNGTAPLNVTGFVHHCNTTGGDCVANASPDSFMWYDELHPSEQTQRIVARNFVDVVRGASKWASYWSG